MELFTISKLIRGFGIPGRKTGTLTSHSLSDRGSFWISAVFPGAVQKYALRQLKPFSRRMAAEAARSPCSMAEILIPLDQREQVETIGFVQQSPENQIATDKGLHELAFGWNPSVIYPDHPPPSGRNGIVFGIQEWF